MNHFENLRQLGFIRSTEFIFASPEYQNGAQVLICLNNGFSGEYWIRVTPDNFEIALREYTLSPNDIDSVKSMINIDSTTQHFKYTIQFGEFKLDNQVYQLISIPKEKL